MRPFPLRGGLICGSGPARSAAVTPNADQNSRSSLPLLERLQTTFWRRFTAQAGDEKSATSRNGFAMAEGFSAIIALDSSGFFSSKAVVPFRLAAGPLSLRGILARSRNYSFERQLTVSTRFRAFASRAALSMDRDDAAVDSFIAGVIEVASGTASMSNGSVLATAVRVCSASTEPGASAAASWLVQKLFRDLLRAEKSEEHFLTADQLTAHEYVLLLSAALEHALSDQGMKEPNLLEALAKSVSSHWSLDLERTLQGLEPSSLTDSRSALQVDPQQALHQLLRKWLDVVTILLPACHEARASPSTAHGSLEVLVCEVSDFLSQLIAPTEAAAQLRQGQEEGRGRRTSDSDVTGSRLPARKFTDYAPGAKSQQEQQTAPAVKDDLTPPTQPDADSGGGPSGLKERVLALARPVFGTDDLAAAVAEELIAAYGDDEAAAYDDEADLHGEISSSPRPNYFFRLGEILASLSLVQHRSDDGNSGKNELMTTSSRNLVTRLQQLVRAALLTNTASTAQHYYRQTAEVFYVLSTRSFLFLTEGLRSRCTVERSLIQRPSAAVPPALLRTIGFAPPTGHWGDARHEKRLEEEVLYFAQETMLSIDAAVQQLAASPRDAAELLGVALTGMISCTRRLSHDSRVTGEISALASRAITKALQVDAPRLAEGLTPVLSVFAEQVWRALRCPLLNREHLRLLSQHVATGLHSSKLMSEVTQEATELQNCFFLEALVKINFSLKELTRRARWWKAHPQDGDDSPIDAPWVLAREEELAIVALAEAYARGPSSPIPQTQPSRRLLLLCCPVFSSSSNSFVMRRRGLTAEVLAKPQPSDAPPTSVWSPDDGSDLRVLEAALELLFPSGPPATTGRGKSPHPSGLAPPQRLAVFHLLAASVSMRSSFPSRLLASVCRAVRLELATFVPSSAHGDQLVAVALDLLVLACRKNAHVLSGSSGDRGANPTGTAFRTVYRTLGEILTVSRRIRFSGAVRRLRVAAMKSHLKAARRLLQLWLDGVRGLVQRDVAAEWGLSGEQAVLLLSSIMTEAAQVTTALVAPACYQNARDPVTGRDTSFTTTQGVLAVLVLAADALRKAVGLALEADACAPAEADDDEQQKHLQLATVVAVMKVVVFVGQLPSTVGDGVVDDLVAKVNATMSELIPLLVKQLQYHSQPGQGEGEGEGDGEDEDDHAELLIAACDDVASSVELMRKIGLQRTVTPAVKNLLVALREILQAATASEQSPGGAVTTRRDAIDRLGRLVDEQPLEPGSGGVDVDETGDQADQDDEVVGDDDHDLFEGDGEVDVHSIDVTKFFSELSAIIKNRRVADPIAHFGPVAKKVLAITKTKGLPSLDSRGLKDKQAAELGASAASAIFSLCKRLPTTHKLRAEVASALAGLVADSFDEGSDACRKARSASISFIRKLSKGIAACGEAALQQPRPRIEYLMWTVRLLRSQLVANQRRSKFSEPQNFGPDLAATTLRLTASAALSILLPWPTVPALSNVWAEDEAMAYLRTESAVNVHALPSVTNDFVRNSYNGCAALLLTVELINLLALAPRHLPGRLLVKFPGNMQELQYERSNEVAVSELLELISAVEAEFGRPGGSPSSLSLQDSVQMLGMYLLRIFSQQVAQVAAYCDAERHKMDPKLHALVESSVVVPVIRAAYSRVLSLRSRDDHFVASTAIGNIWTALSKTAPVVGDLDVSFLQRENLKSVELSCLTRVLSPTFLTGDGALLLHSGFRCAQSCCAALLLHLLTAVRTSECELQALLTAMNHILRFTTPRNIAAVRFCDSLCVWVASFVQCAHLPADDPTLSPSSRSCALSLCAQLVPKLSLISTGTESAASSSSPTVPDKVVLQCVAVLLRGDTNIRDEPRLAMLLALVEARPRLFGESMESALQQYHGEPREKNPEAASTAEAKIAHQLPKLSRVPFLKILNTMQKAVHDQKARAMAQQAQEAAKEQLAKLTPAERAAHASRGLDDDRATLHQSAANSGEGAAEFDPSSGAAGPALIPASSLAHLNLTLQEVCSLGAQLAYTDVEVAASRRGHVLNYTEREKLLMADENDVQLAPGQKLFVRAIASSLRQLYLSLVARTVPKLSHPSDLADVVTILRMSDSNWRISHKIDSPLAQVHQVIAIKAEELCGTIGARNGGGVARGPADDQLLRRTLLDMKEIHGNEEKKAVRLKQQRSDRRNLQRTK